MQCEPRVDNHLPKNFTRHAVKGYTVWLMSVHIVDSTGLLWADNLYETMLLCTITLDNLTNLFIIWNDTFQIVVGGGVHIIFVLDAGICFILSYTSFPGWKSFKFTIKDMHCFLQAEVSLIRFFHIRFLTLAFVVLDLIHNRSLAMRPLWELSDQNSLGFFLHLTSLSRCISLLSSSSGTWQHNKHGGQLLQQ